MELPPRRRGAFCTEYYNNKAEDENQNQNKLFLYSQQMMCPISTSALTLCDVYKSEAFHLSALQWKTASAATTRGFNTATHMQRLGFVVLEAQIS